jgi:hypothetical protein
MHVIASVLNLRPHFSGRLRTHVHSRAAPEPGRAVVARLLGQQRDAARVAALVAVDYAGLARLLADDDRALRKQPSRSPSPSPAGDQAQAQAQAMMPTAREYEHGSPATRSHLVVAELLRLLRHADRGRPGDFASELLTSAYYAGMLCARRARCWE